MSYSRRGGWGGHHPPAAGWVRCTECGRLGHSAKAHTRRMAIIEREGDGIVRLRCDRCVVRVSGILDEQTIAAFRRQHHHRPPRHQPRVEP